jgi:hypothetical protein
MDADGATALESVAEMFARLESDLKLDGVIGSRIKMLGKNVQRSSLRHYVGRLFATYFNALFDIPVYDSQCGAKVFRKEVVLRALPLVSDYGFTWDTQLVVLLMKLGANVVEHPVSWKEVGNNKVSMLRDPIKMAWKLWRFRQTLKARLNRR